MVKRVLVGYGIDVDAVSGWYAVEPCLPRHTVWAITGIILGSTLVQAHLLDRLTFLVASLALLLALIVFSRCWTGTGLKQHGLCLRIRWNLSQAR